MVSRIIHLTDLHLLAAADGMVRGIDSYLHLTKVIAFLNTNIPLFDAMIITGDLAQDEKAETYLRLRELLTPWIGKYYLIPGNHDNRPALRQIYPEQPYDSSHPFCSFSINLSGWRIIGLDSHVPGQDHGKLGRQQLGWLRSKLERYGSQPTLIFMHHFPLMIDCPWFDCIGLLDTGEFANIISEHRQIKSIFTGHIHHELDRHLDDIPVHSTPATSFQFDITAPEPTCSGYIPAFRVIDLEQTDFTSRVCHSG